MTISLDTEQSVVIPVGNIQLDGILSIPAQSKGLVIFVHGSGSSRLSTRNQFVAKVLNQNNLATLLFDLLTPDEEVIDSQTAALRFNIPFLASRLLIATDWCSQQPALQSLSMGYFGASTGGAAALVAAATKPSIKAVVSRGGRPDLAKESLTKVKAPTLLIVGGNDDPVIAMNNTAMAQMNCITELKIIPGATHLFEEPGALDKVAVLAKEWFIIHL